MKSKILNKQNTGIASRLREIRLKARMTQKEMGAIVGLTSGSVGALENGLYTPNYDVLRAIHKRFNVSYEYIIDGINRTNDVSNTMRENIELKSDITRLKMIIDELLVRKKG